MKLNIGGNNLKELSNIDRIFSRVADSFNYSEGIKEIESIIKRNPEFLNRENVLLKVGMLYDHFATQQRSLQKRNIIEKKALAFYQSALKINPKSHGATWGIGRVWWHRKSKKAISYAKRAYLLAKQNGMDAGIYAQNVGAVYRAIGNLKRSEFWLIKGAKESPTDWGVYLNLISFYKSIGRVNKASLYRGKLKFFFDKESKKKKDTKWGKMIKEIIREK